MTTQAGIDTPEDLRRIAATVARAAGTQALAARRSLGIGQLVAHDTKSTPTDPVTEYDRAAESLVVDAIATLRPDDSIVGEEGAAHAGTSGLSWHVDPIDGTVNFVYDLPAWCTSVAVVDADGPLAGAVYAPVTDELFSASRGGGATLDDETIHCSGADDLAMALVGTGFNYSGERRSVQAQRLPLLLSEVRDIRRYGSAALDLCMAACGRLDAYFEEYLNSWDLAAGVLIAAEAGATTSALDGGVAGPASVVACAPSLHRPLLEAIERIDARIGH